MIQTDSYQKEELTIEAAKANANSILISIPIVLLIGLPYYLLWKETISNTPFKNLLMNDQPWLSTGVFVIIMIAGIVVHELIHGVTWSLYAKEGFRSIKFGVLWKHMIPYCHCKEPLLVKQYILGGIMPAIVLGFIPSIIAILTGSSSLLLFGLFFTISAGGDFMIINLLRKENSSSLVQDHPSKIGCYIYRKV